MLNTKHYVVKVHDLK